MADTTLTQPWQRSVAKAQRQRQLANTLMQGVMAPTQGGMVGRYYVGEGLGGGLIRLGQALLARKFDTDADQAEAGAIAERQRANEAAFDALTQAVSPRDEWAPIGDNMVEAKKTTITPSGQDIGRALMRYQNATGQELPSGVVKMLAPAVVDSKRYSTTMWKDGIPYQLTEGSAPVSLGEGWSMPTRTVDTDNAVLVVPTVGNGGPVKTYEKGVSPGKKYEVATAPVVAAAKAEAEAAAKRKSEQSEKAETADVAVGLLDKYIDAVGRQPATAAGRGFETAAGIVGAGNKRQQDAIAEADNLGSQLLTYAQKQPGPSSDKDVQNYSRQVGVLANPLATREQKIAAAKTAKEAYLRVIARYGKNWKASAGGAAPASGRVDVKSLFR